MTAGQVRVAVVGAGDVGRGWAAMCVAQGWPVSLFDTDAAALEHAQQEIATRATTLVALERADAAAAKAGIAQLTVGRSILHTCGDAQWVIEAGPEDIRTKQKMFEAIESVAGKARAVTSSSSGLKAADIAARCVRQERCFVAHPLNPPELIPLVELVPGPLTDHALIELVKGWLHALGRISVVIKKPVPGNVANRIAAAVWREAIDLVLEGVIDVDDLDRAVSVGPGLGWAAAGPHLTYHLAAGEQGVSGFLQHLLRTFETIWEDLPTWSKLELEQQRRLITLIERAYDGQVSVIRPARDRRLAAILRGLELARGE
ncbi:MAG: 3-hydroxyacyl-CoA dehydrogenase [Gemmatimonadales bacterium]|nr:3-hydroxyacyl-CoA dehydrogenase [Gemmatimonadales bacterium]NIN12900.1 3-hydroxyacyl-CoA dehydrogenase [Gemmatimonadales bacterium]NIR00187.1 3-hydroxyacyl-CoA dehydrogenase [Gemmatimonadales bacterium]NIS65980.1 3-hydroxyacyl-CoA dehydrogenase [Gemmatimonadales bacterium]